MTEEQIVSSWLNLSAIDIAVRFLISIGPGIYSVNDLKKQYEDRYEEPVPVDTRAWLLEALSRGIVAPDEKGLLVVSQGGLQFIRNHSRAASGIDPVSDSHKQVPPRTNDI